MDFAFDSGDVSFRLMWHNIADYLSTLFVVSWEYQGNLQITHFISHIAMCDSVTYDL